MPKTVSILRERRVLWLSHLISNSPSWISIWSQTKNWRRQTIKNSSKPINPSTSRNSSLRIFSTIWFSSSFLKMWPTKARPAKKQSKNNHHRSNQARKTRKTRNANKIHKNSKPPLSKQAMIQQLNLRKRRPMALKVQLNFWICQTLKRSVGLVK